MATVANEPNILSLETTVVPIKSLKTLPGNPNKGNVQAIAESLKVNKQYRPLVVQKKTKYVLAGNHTFLAAKSLGWEKIAVNYVDVDEVQAKRIVIADNRTAALGEIDPELLGAILQGMPDVSGTGYTDFEAKQFLDTIRENQVDLSSISTPGELDENIASSVPAGLDEDVESPWTSDVYEGTISSDGEDKSDFENAPEITKGITQLDEDPIFDGVGYFGLPIIRPDMLVETLPEPLVTWAGSATKDWPDPETWWFYNYGIDSTSGMKDVSKVVLSFYAYDDYFENWWFYTTNYMAKALNSGIKYAVMPDFSMDTDYPRVESLYQLYRARFLGRYFQEVGIRLIPNINWRYNDIDFLKKYVLPGLPVNAPWIASGLVAFDAKLPPEEYKIMGDCFRVVVDTLKPQNYLMYTDKAGKKFFESLNLPVNIRYQEARMTALAEQAKGRQKKTTL